MMVGNKAYQKQMAPIFTEDNVTKKKGQVFLDSADKLRSFSISSIHQPIESLCNWIEEKTQIQMASKVRSLKGLMVHIYGRLAIALFLIKNKMTKSCS